MIFTTGHGLLGNVESVMVRKINIITDGGRAMFEVELGEDDTSITIRTPGDYNVNGVEYSSQLIIEPNVSNSITLRTKPYS